MSKDTCPFLGEQCKFNFHDTFLSLPPSKKTELLIELFKNKWTVPIYGAGFGLGLIFIMAIFYAFFGKENDPSVSEKIFTSLQIWVGFLLGIIATIFSIISMYLSFYNLEQQYQVEKRTQDLNDKLTESFKDIINTKILKPVEDIGKKIDKMETNNSINQATTTVNLSQLESVSENKSNLFTALD